MKLRCQQEDDVMADFRMNFEMIQLKACQCASVAMGKNTCLILYYKALLELQLHWDDKSIRRLVRGTYICLSRSISSGGNLQYVCPIPSYPMGQFPWECHSHGHWTILSVYIYTVFLNVNRIFTYRIRHLTGVRIQLNPHIGFSLLYPNQRSAFIAVFAASSTYTKLVFYMKNTLL